MFSFCLDPGFFGFIFLSVSSACSLFVSSSYPSHPRDPCSFHLVSETKRISAPAPCESKTAGPISRCLGGYCVWGGMCAARQNKSACVPVCRKSNVSSVSFLRPYGSKRPKVERCSHVISQSGSM